MISYAILLCLALALNHDDRRMLGLTAMVGAGIFVAVPSANFYLLCILGETLIALVALQLRARASMAIVQISTVLVAFHALGWGLNGYPIHSPYHIMVQICEHAELLMCILLSSKFLPRDIYDPRLR